MLMEGTCLAYYGFHLMVAIIYTFFHKQHSVRFSKQINKYRKPWKYSFLFYLKKLVYLAKRDSGYKFHTLRMSDKSS